MGLVDESLDSLESSFREKLIEHLLVGELLKYSWEHTRRSGDPLIEISNGEVDRGGYDLIAEFAGHLRHIQLKGSRVGATTAKQNVRKALAEKPSGCVVWVFFSENPWNLGPFLYFGAEPGAQLPALGDRTARHEKGDANGIKRERPKISVVTKSKFKQFGTIAALWEALFGSTATLEPQGDVLHSTR